MIQADVVALTTRSQPEVEKVETLGLSALAHTALVGDRLTMERIANRTDEDLQDAVEGALRSAVGDKAPHLGVSADHGTVTLTGQVHTNEERQSAHAAVLEVWGVHSVADDIVVRDSYPSDVNDTEIAKAAQASLSRTEGVAHDAIVAEVRDHIITLSGMVRSPSERLAAERAVIYLPGVVEINNRITVDEA